MRTYAEWVTVREPELFWREEEVSLRKSSQLPYLPLISVILPTFNTPPYFLKRCVESVLEQHYENWQLCIADDNSSDLKVFSALQEYAQRDPRIHLDRSSCQGGISVASNAALQSATGDFVVLLDHDDELHPSALLELARAVNSYPQGQLFYSDEDKIDEFGIRSQPSFKPDFDENIFLSFNYLGHMIALKQTLVTQLGGFRPSCDGAQDWDLLLRATEMLNPEAIRHIRKPLYHWRMHENSTSVNLDAKPYVAKAWMRVLEDHVARTGKNASVNEGLFYGSMRLRYEAPIDATAAAFIRPEDGMFQASVVKVNAGLRPLSVYQTVDCAVFRLPDDNPHSAQTHTSPCSLTELEEEVLIFVNGPLECLSHLFFEELIAQALRKDCGVVTGISLDFKNDILATGFVRGAAEEISDPYVGIQFPNNGYMGQISVVRSLDACPGTFFATHRRHLAAVGGLGAISSSHPQFLARELSRNALAKGLSIIFTPYAVATFSESCSRPVAQDIIHQQTRDLCRLNPHIAAFECTQLLLQGSLE